LAAAMKVIRGRGKGARLTRIGWEDNAIIRFSIRRSRGAGRGSGTSLPGPKRRAVEPCRDTCDTFARAICFNRVREGAWMQAFELSFVRGLVAVISMALCLSACEVRPLYGPTTMGIPLADELKAIEITPIPDRIGHYVRNELIFAFNGTGSETTPARYVTVHIPRPFRRRASRGSWAA
jgi:hypothetical protein